MGELWLESDGEKHQQQSNDEEAIPGEQCWQSIGKRAFAGQQQQ